MVIGITNCDDRRDRISHGTPYFSVLYVFFDRKWENVRLPKLQTAAAIREEEEVAPFSTANHAINSTPPPKGQ